MLKRKLAPDDNKNKMEPKSKKQKINNDDKKKKEEESDYDEEYLVIDENLFSTHKSIMESVKEGSQEKFNNLMTVCTDRKYTFLDSLKVAHHERDTHYAKFIEMKQKWLNKSMIALHKKIIAAVVSGNQDKYNKVRTEFVPYEQSKIEVIAVLKVQANFPNNFINDKRIEMEKKWKKQNSI